MRPLTHSPPLAPHQSAYGRLPVQPRLPRLRPGPLHRLLRRRRHRVLPECGATHRHCARSVLLRWRPCAAPCRSAYPRGWPGFCATRWRERYPPGWRRRRQRVSSVISRGPRRRVGRPQAQPQRRRAEAATAAKAARHWVEKRAFRHSEAAPQRAALRLEALEECGAAAAAAAAAALVALLWASRQMRSPQMRQVARRRSQPRRARRNREERHGRRLRLRQAKRRAARRPGHLCIRSQSHRRM